MKILVELGGISRVLTGVREVPLEVADDTTFRDILAILGTRYPVLIGQVIQPDGTDLFASNMLNLNGRHMLREDQLDESPQDGDRVLLMSVLAGG